MLLGLTLVFAAANAQSLPEVQARSLTLQGDFNVNGAASYFFDDAKSDPSILSMKVDARRIDYELDTASNRVSAFHVVATQGTESTTPWTRTAAHLETVASHPNSQLALIAIGTTKVSSDLACLHVTSERSQAVQFVHANTKRGPTALPADPLLTLRGCSQVIQLEGDFQLLAWEWSLAGHDADGNQDTIFTGTSDSANTGDPGVALSSNSELYATLRDATITLNVPDSQRWTLAAQSLSILGSGSISMTGAAGAVLDGGQVVNVRDHFAMPMTGGTISLTPQGDHLVGSVHQPKQLASNVTPFASVPATWLPWILAIGFAGLSVVMYKARGRRSLAVQSSPKRIGTRPRVARGFASGSGSLTQLDAAKQRFAALYAQLPE